MNKELNRENQIYIPAQDAELFFSVHRYDQTNGSPNYSIVYDLIIEVFEVEFRKRFYSRDEIRKFFRDRFCQRIVSDEQLEKIFEGKRANDF